MVFVQYCIATGTDSMHGTVLVLVELVYGATVAVDFVRAMRNTRIEIGLALPSKR